MPEYTCDECGATNEIPTEVMEICTEHWRPCDNCGERHAFNFSR